ncbi:OB-fold protein [Trueperella sp. LYQ141]|uniref:OB-fold protein n=1 Tax=Trueperella sp. LYQ141 TaxID=3391058 RepID=UPI003982FE41
MYGYPPLAGQQVAPEVTASNTEAKKPFYKKWWFWLIVVIAVAVIATQMSGGSKSEDQSGAHSSSTSQTSQDSGSATSEDQGASTESETESEQKAAAPELTVTVTDLTKAYQENELAADKQYKDKVIQVTGKMDQVTDILNHKTLFLGSGEQFAIHGVSCPISDEQIDKAAGLSKGADVTVIGTVDGFDQLNVELSDCVIQ